MCIFPLNWFTQLWHIWAFFIISSCGDNRWTVCVYTLTCSVLYIYIPQLIFQCGVSLPAWLCSCFSTDLCKKPLKALFYSFTTEHPLATNKVMKFSTTWWSQPDLCLLNTDIICSQFHKEILLKTFCSLSLFFFYSLKNVHGFLCLSEALVTSSGYQCKC